MPRPPGHLLAMCRSQLEPYTYSCSLIHTHREHQSPPRPLLCFPSHRDEMFSSPFSVMLILKQALDVTVITRLDWLPKFERGGKQDFHQSLNSGNSSTILLAFTKGSRFHKYYFHMSPKAAGWQPVPQIWLFCFNTRNLGNRPGGKTHKSRLCLLPSWPRQSLSISSKATCVPEHISSTISFHH